MSEKILIVGDCPTRDDIAAGRPFSGQYGQFLSSLLAECGLRLEDCYTTFAVQRPAPSGNTDNLVKKTAKGFKVCDDSIYEDFAKLHAEIAVIKPDLIIALGNIALVALSGEIGITKWRGSQLTYRGIEHTCKLLPTYSPLVLLKKYDWVYDFKLDIKRALSDWVEPEYNFITAPNYYATHWVLDDLLLRCEEGPTKIAVDIETRSGHIACCGLAWSKTEAICIPFMKAGRRSGYWGPSEETAIILKLRSLFLHPNFRGIFQNGAFDIQYFSRWWGCFFLPHLDTMYAHHVCWAGLKKSLDYLSAMYCRYHVYWKDDGKHFDLEHHDEQRLWTYNCKDCVVTFEVGEALEGVVEAFGLQEQLDFQLCHNLRTTMRMMMRGVRRDEKAQEELRNTLWEDYSERLVQIRKFVGREINPKSPKQVAELFYEEFGQEKVIHRKRKNVTTDDEALTKIAKRCPLLRHICYPLLDCRAIGTLSSTFVEMKADIDGRIRCSYNIAGTETYRYASSRNAFDSGGNLQNVPNPEKDKGVGRYRSPNIKRMFLPDEGYEIADFDLDRADLQVVVWEADEEELKELLRLGVDIHLANAQVIFNLPFNVEDLRDPEIAGEIKKKFKRQRNFSKQFVHGTDYGGSARTMAAAAHCSIIEAETAQKAWFGKYPGIKDWHKRIERQLQVERMVVNKFGFRRYYFDRIEGLLPEALGWLPQSTVAIVIDKGMVNVDENLAHLDVQCLLQVHDSIVVQYPKNNRTTCLESIRKEMQIVVPYDDPLIIPVGAKVSDVSWGDCEEIEF